MKSKMRTWIVMMLVLASTSTGVAFAGTTDTMLGNKGTLQSKLDKIVSRPAEKVRIAKATPFAATQLPYRAENLAEQLGQLQDVTYGTSDLVDGKPGLQRDLGTLAKGYLRFSVRNISDGVITIGIYKAANAQTPIKKIDIQKQNSKDNPYSVETAILEPGQYWIAVQSNSGITGTQKVTAMAQYFSAADRSIAKEQAYCIGHVTAGQVNDFKWKASSTGAAEFISGFNESQEAGTVTLCDSGKKPLSNAVTFNSRQLLPPVFGVQKGKVYYFRVKITSPIALTKGVVYVTLGNEKTGIGGKSMKKAKKLAKANPGTGVVIAGSKRTYWHRFTTKKKVTFGVVGMTNKKLKVTCFTKKAGEKTKKRSYYITRNKMVIKAKVKKGATFYIKIAPADKQSSGFYALAWE